MAFDAGASLADNVARMTAESAALRSFTVFTAARDSAVDGRSVRKGQVLALDAGRRLLACEASVEAATLRALARLDDVELVTCYHGVGVTAEQVDALAEAIAAQDRDIEVEMVPGGQRHDHLLVAVE